MWQEILRDYDKTRSGDAAEEIAWFKEQPSLREAIGTAVRAVKRDRKRYDHQYRIWRSAIPQAIAALLALEGRIARVETFDELLHLITEQLRDIPGIGELYYYDTAFRIGVYLGIYPTRVYLHAGTRAGARKLQPPVDYRKDALEIGELPSELRGRPPYVTENILCIYRDWFGGDAHQIRRNRRAGRC
ncbi:MAG: hypothetical protein JO093_04610 [Acidobacteria bacterium]|nr:hypothetical protein [Acidobacteriota bacterium]MBV9184874.1 hypothetical protein [Acidobacteriota bacterium]